MLPRPAGMKVTKLGPLQDGHGRLCAILAWPAPTTPCSHLSVYSAKLSTFQESSPRFSKALHVFSKAKIINFALSFSDVKHTTGKLNTSSFHCKKEINYKSRQ